MDWAVDSLRILTKNTLIKYPSNILQETYYKRTVERNGNINKRKAHILGMYAVSACTQMFGYHCNLTIFIMQYMHFTGETLK